MTWWDLTSQQKWSVLAIATAIAALPGIVAVIVGAWPLDWRVLSAACAFIAIPEFVGGMLFVGLKTGRMPSRGSPIERRTDPFWFWTTAAMHGVVLVAYVGLIGVVAIDAIRG